MLLVDPGIHGNELAALAGELIEHGDAVSVGFATHPHSATGICFGTPGSVRLPATAPLSAATVQARLELGHMAIESAQDVSLDLFGAIIALPPRTEYIPWDGPRVRIVEHQAHSPGHAALLVIENERLAPLPATWSPTS